MNEVLTAVNGCPLLDDVLEARVQLTPHLLIITGQTLHRSLLSLNFSPVQALRFTMTDCYVVPDRWEIKLNQLSIVQNSRWLASLRKAVASADVASKLLDYSQHYLLVTDDVVIELVASAWHCEHLNQ